METIDTEHDRNISRSILAMLLSRDDLNNRGVNPTRAKSKLDTMKEVLDAIQLRGV